MSKIINLKQYRDAKAMFNQEEYDYYTELYKDVDWEEMERLNRLSNEFYSTDKDDK